MEDTGRSREHRPVGDAWSAREHEQAAEHDGSERQRRDPRRADDWYRADHDPRAPAASGNPDQQDMHYRGYYRSSSVPFRSADRSGNVYLESWVLLAGPHSGRGPRGYKRSDERIIEEACQRLEQDGAIDARDIEVSCEDGVITLEGSVEDRSAKRRAEECVEFVYGAKDVMNRLRIKCLQSARRRESGDSATNEPTEPARTLKS